MDQEQTPHSVGNCTGAEVGPDRCEPCVTFPGEYPPIGGAEVKS